MGKRPARLGKIYGVCNHSFLRILPLNDNVMHACVRVLAYRRVPAGGARKGSGPQLGDEDVQFAADLAAHFSKGRDDGKCDVMVARAAAVKKPKGAKPGQVLCRLAGYVNQDSLWFTMTPCIILVAWPWRYGEISWHHGAAAICRLEQNRCKQRRGLRGRSANGLCWKLCVPECVHMH